MTVRRMLFDNMRSFCVLLDRNGDVLDTNLASREFIGAESSQIQGTAIWEIPGRLNSPEIVCKFKNAISQGVGGVASRFETLHIGDAGNDVHMDFSLTPVRDNDNNVDALILEGHDITEFKRSQLALIRSEHRFRSLIELSSDWYWEQDEHYRFIEISGNVEKLAGTSVISLLGKCRWELSLIDRDLEQWSEHRAILEHHEPFRNFEYRRTSAAGDEVWLSTSGDPIFDSDNIFQGYRGTSRNITQQKQSEAALEESQTRLRLVLQMSGIGVWAWNLISDEVTWDKRQFELFGLDEVDGPINPSTVFNTMHIEDQEYMSTAVGNVIEDGITAFKEFRVVHPDGSVHWLLGCIGIAHVDQSGSPTLLVGVNMDITKSKQIELALREHQGQLQIANLTLEERIAERTVQLETEAEQHKRTQDELAFSRRLESMGQLAGGVAHDFNNLLSVIGGNLELAAPYITQPDASIMIAEALTAVESGTRLNRRLLTFAQKQHLSPMVLSTCKPVMETVRLLERTLDERIALDMKTDAMLWNIYVDPGELDSAIVNLAVNARDAMPQGGSLIIETRNKVLTEEECGLIPGAVPGDYVVIIVQDTGTGMSSDVMQKALDPFFTTKEQGKGTGLGLSSVYGFVRESGGFLSIDSRIEQGTTVRMFLPRASGSGVTSTVPATVSAQKRQYSDRELILVVEDDSMVRTVTVKRLRYLGYQIVEASTANEAMGILSTDAPVKLVFSDVVMPGAMTGYDLADWLSRNRKDVKVLLTSGYTDPDLQVDNSTGRLDITVLEKPHSIDMLAERVQDALCLISR